MGIVKAKLWENISEFCFIQPASVGELRNIFILVDGYSPVPGPQQVSGTLALVILVVPATQGYYPMK
jgi:hypothetical protein